MAKATFSRKPETAGIKIGGTVTRKGKGLITDAEANEILQKVVSAIDNTAFEVETLTATVK